MKCILTHVVPKQEVEQDEMAMDLHNQRENSHQLSLSACFGHMHLNLLLFLHYAVKISILQELLFIIRTKIEIFYLSIFRKKVIKPNIHVL